MPKGPKGHKRSADVISNAVKVMRISTGEEEEDCGQSPNRAKGGRKGAKVRAARLTPRQRSEIAQTAAAARRKAKRLRPHLLSRSSRSAARRSAQSSAKSVRNGKLKGLADVIAVIAEVIADE
jgi:hypothetical protein